MPEDNEKRLSALERTQDKMENTLDQINKTLLRFENHIDELFEVKTKLDSIDVIWRKVDDLQTKTGNIDVAFQLLKAEHIVCKPVVDTIAIIKTEFNHRLQDLEKSRESVGGFTKNLVGGLLGQILWALVGGGALAAIYLAGKGAFVK